MCGENVGKRRRWCSRGYSWNFHGVLHSGGTFTFSLSNFLPLSMFLVYGPNFSSLFFSKIKWCYQYCNFGFSCTTSMRPELAGTSLNCLAEVTTTTLNSTGSLRWLCSVLPCLCGCQASVWIKYSYIGLWCGSILCIGVMYSYIDSCGLLSRTS